MGKLTTLGQQSDSKHVHIFGYPYLLPCKTWIPYGIFINICCDPRVVLKLEPERQRFRQLPRSCTDVNVSDNMFDHCYCIKSFCCSKTLGEKLRF